MDALKASIAHVQDESGAVTAGEAEPATRAKGRRAPRPAEDPAGTEDAPGAAGESPHEQQHFAGMTKADLLARAAELEVEGRSKMSKEQLVIALSERDGQSRRTRRVS